MKETLRWLIPKIFPDWREDQHWISIPHRGKSDLEKSIPRKIRAWHEQNVKFVIMRDNDGGDCHARKERLLELAAVDPLKPVLVRIVCQELESWFLGDLNAVAKAFPKRKITRTELRAAKFKKPDQMTNASDELYRLINVRGKVLRAEKIAPHMNIEGNCSPSFQFFVSGLKRFVETGSVPAPMMR